MTREFEAPRSVVYRAWSEPELLKLWLGPAGWSLPECDIDLRAGGSYRAKGRAPDGTEMSWGGDYKEVIPEERIVQTESFDEPWNAGTNIVTTEFAEQDGNTVVTTTIKYESHAIRQAVMKSGMDKGVAESYERLDKVLADLTAAA